MPLFGNLFKQPKPYSTPGIGDGVNPPLDNWYDPLPQETGYKQPSKAMQILGVIGDALATTGGAQPVFLPQMLDLQQRADQERRQLEMYERKRSDDWTDFQRENQWKVDHTPPELPPMIRDANAWRTATPEQREAITAIERLRNPPPFFTGADGQSYQRPDPNGPAPGSVVPAPWLQGGAAPTATVPFQRLDAITAETESGNRRYGAGGQLLTSPKGALGEMQVMPSTARDPGFGLRPADPNNPDDLARLGREYRSAMHNKYGGDLPSMWGAYNAGPGRVDDLKKRYGPGWLQYAPAETRAYVQRNMMKLRSR